MKPEELGQVTLYGHALGHPLRVQFLTLAAEGPISPVMGSKQHNLGPLGVVSYHAATLLKLECLEEIHSRPRRGALEHFYVATKRGVDVLRVAHAVIEPPEEEAKPDDDPKG